jgi:hypothetical protein
LFQPKQAESFLHTLIQHDTSLQRRIATPVIAIINDKEIHQEHGPSTALFPKLFTPQLPILLLSIKGI